ncbi:uncharacterized protein LOC111700015 [Eurytemora carolleeae]|uniref:uncharacterized protein LOC111700015 n=1 Tax=Eurytemora carolleeae TaxID=1294199 RepID=UPI000C790D58|nr:uncharacterized protein LOC111700015 [Eurytemora carolleeae]|eukprot:XP_023326594.1 uncharacterized protein LOC111700015 [Eurytemora affinis]
MVEEEDYDEEFVLENKTGSSPRGRPRESRTMSAMSRRTELDQPRPLSADRQEKNLGEPRSLSARRSSLDEMGSISVIDGDLSPSTSSRRRFVFDHLWGIPGDTGDTQLRFLQQINKKKEVEYIVLTGREKNEKDESWYWRTFSSYCIHSSWHGFKYLVYCKKHLSERIIWFLLCLAGLAAAIVLMVLGTTEFRTDNVVLDISEDYIPRFPDLILCPVFTISKKDEVEKLLPPMKLLWDSYPAPNAGFSQPNSLPWRNETWPVQQLFSRILRVGAGLGGSDCSDIVKECLKDGIKMDCCSSSQVYEGEHGTCIRIQGLGSERDRKGNENLKIISGDLKTVSKNLNISVLLGSVKSRRIGPPIVSAKYFASSGLCDSQWGDKEARVFCRSLGFSGGIKYKDEVRPTPGPGFGQLLGRFNCRGDEINVGDCIRDTQYMPDDCSTPTSSTVQCDPGGLNGEHKQTKTSGAPFLKYGSGEKYFCKEGFGDLEATVFCRMLGWSVGKIKPNQTLRNPVVYTASCTGTETHILDCKTNYTESGLSCDSVWIECSPGFPLRLRLDNPLPTLSFSEVGLGIGNSTAGYPVVETTGAPVYICNSGTNHLVPGLVCRSLRFQQGSRLSPALFRRIETTPPVFGFQYVRCLGEESSVFSCDLSPWGVHGCKSEDLFTVLCYNGSSVGDIVPEIKTEPVQTNLLNRVQNIFNTPDLRIVNPIVKLGTLVAPICNFGASLQLVELVCKQEGHHCGFINTNKTYTTQNISVVSEISCGANAQNLKECHVQLSSSCGDDRLLSITCINKESPLYQECVFLSSKGATGDITRSLKVRFNSIGSKDECNNKFLKAFIHSDEASNEIRIQDSRSQLINIKTISTDREVGCEKSENYDQRICQQQCKARISECLCDCAPYSLIPLHLLGSQVHNTGSGYIRPCSNITCYSNLHKSVWLAPYNLPLALRISGAAGIDGESSCSGVQDYCSCPPPCSHTQFSSQIIWEKPCAETSLEMVLDPTSTVSRRVARRSTWIDDLVRCGAVFSLLTGLSLISLLEILYFLTWRLYEEYTSDTKNVRGGTMKNDRSEYRRQDDKLKGYSGEEFQTSSSIASAWLE